MFLIRLYCGSTSKNYWIYLGPYPCFGARVKRVAETGVEGILHTCQPWKKTASIPPFRHEWNEWRRRGGVGATFKKTSNPKEFQLIVGPSSWDGFKKLFHAEKDTAWSAGCLMRRVFNIDQQKYRVLNCKHDLMEGMLEIDLVKIEDIPAGEEKFTVLTGERVSCPRHKDVSFPSAGHPEVCSHFQGLPRIPESRVVIYYEFFGTRGCAISVRPPVLSMSGSFLSDPVYTEIRYSFSSL